ncbi:NAD dependent epimerase/dehydratase family protein [Acrodontium crateriforme]|uniref:NAD dependent epimerase/dehydratase family protein n=1 Tax=Acrodontium crateriforme TaxID=150365 RepID=A0AAQ3MCA5_9PEZI|nr:NAD dependent epimerase/dehydratase family protein [Acrodontium crateriforme]
MPYLLIGEGYTVTGLVRRNEHAEQIKSSRASCVSGDWNNKDTITKQVLKHDIAFHTATADHLPSVEAVLDGVKQPAQRGETTVFIHTSGTIVLDDCAEGKSKSDKVYHDDMRQETDGVPDGAPHREIDLAIVRAQQKLGEQAKIAIMIPPLIYGFNPVHRRLTIYIPTLTRFAIKHGFAAHIGEGLSVESNVHVLDLARAYITLLHHLEESKPKQTLANPYFYC